MNNYYLKEGQLRWAKLQGYWLDASTFESLFLANLYWARKSGNSKLAKLLGYMKIGGTEL